MKNKQILISLAIAGAFSTAMAHQVEEAPAPINTDIPNRRGPYMPIIHDTPRYGRKANRAQRRTNRRRL